ncbi:SsrA-binding protein SmpB [Patescibacteria group bacterium]|nr:SsrA-binding protein SmpB [Patescibacteria group bacterium]
MKILNRQASYRYQLLEKFEAGIVLTGAEVKSVRQGHLQLGEAFVRVKDGEAWLFNAHIHPYSFSNKQKEEDPQRTRKLLLHKKELLKLKQATDQKGLTLVPVSCYTKRNKIKLEIAIAKGKREHEKREAIKKKDWQRELKV